MRRIAALLALVLAGTAVAIGSVGGSGAQAGSTYRVDAIFDTAKGIIPGQLVKIAGARVGEIDDVRLTPDYKARIQMKVEQRFAPFRSDARCEIQPEGLIAENFVQCEPGTPDGRELRGVDGEAPTVPLERNSVPVNLTDLFQIWQLPVRQRFSIVVNSLGLGLAARGEDVNALLRRANPTLELARETLGILNRQREQVSTIVRATDRVIGELADRKDRVGDFVEQGDRVLSQTASRRGELADAVRRLPGLLDAARPALERLDRVARDGTPVLRDVRAATPALERLVTDLKPFADAGVPVLRRLEPAARTGRRATRSAKPVVSLLREIARDGRTGVPLLRALVVSLRDQGGIESLLRFIYFGAVASSRYDEISHILPAHTIFSSCFRYSEVPVEGCSANYGAEPHATARKRERSTDARKAPAASRVAPTPPPTAPPTPGAAPNDQPERLLDGLVDFLLGT